MKRSVILLLVFINQLAFAQTQEPLYYFINRDSLVGVIDSKCKIIIPAKHRRVFDRNDGEKIPDGLIDLYFAVYNREGKFLYHPLIFDSAPDEIHEGLTRFVENGKIGFADRTGKKVIAAQFKFTSWFDLGTAMFCKGCYFDTAKDPEHPTLINGIYGFVDRTGKILIDQIAFDSSDFFWEKLDSIRQVLYSEQFQHSDLEKDILNKFDRYKNAIEKEYFFNWSDAHGSMSLVFDVVEKPSPGFPYYVIYSREKVGKKMRGYSWDDLHFYVSKDGKTIYYVDGDNLITFHKWYSLYIQGKRDFE